MTISKYDELYYVNKDAFSLVSPEFRYGELFKMVQTSIIFKDSKTFTDLLPKFSTEEIMQKFNKEKIDIHFDLKSFINQNFAEPQFFEIHFDSDRDQPIGNHIKLLWDVLQRNADIPDNSSLIPLLHPYIVPGGRFREVYYWDSYFTMLGLAIDNRLDLIENIIDNFAYLIKTLGFIPNGNRTYYNTRSQPPFFPLMVYLFSDIKKDKSILLKYLPYIQAEYDYWMRSDYDTSGNSISKLIQLGENELLNRYYDTSHTPRPEGFKEDVEIAHEYLNFHKITDKMFIDNLLEDKYNHIRSAAESGWDFSSRWFYDSESKQKLDMECSNIIPIDLNCIMYKNEKILQEAYTLTGDLESANKYCLAFENRKNAILKYCYDKDNAFFFDYNFKKHKKTNVWAISGVFPLYVQLVDEDISKGIVENVKNKFLMKGGVTTTLHKTGEQWDSPNGWAPLQYITVKGLNNYGYVELAQEIKKRWTDLNISMYRQTGKLLEKYNVEDVQIIPQGGEYEVQDGFGWTNGVLKYFMEGNVL